MQTDELRPGLDQPPGASRFSGGRMMSDAPRPFIVERVKRRPGAPTVQKAQPTAAAAAAPDLRLADELEYFAGRIRQLRAIGNNGDATPFYEDRSQAARDAADFASWVRKGTPPASFMPAAARAPDRLRTRYAERH